MAQERLGPLTPGQREALSAMEGGIATLTRIAEDAYRVAQIQSERLVLSPGMHEVRQLLEEAAARASRAGRRRAVEVDLETAEPLEPVTVDGPRLTEAVTHLVTNAIRFTPDGGRITLRAFRHVDELVIEVEDTGVGIPADKLQRLLERSLVLRDPLNHHSSSTLEFNSSGLGLGIPIARGVAEAHGGRLAARARSGGGMIFAIHLPSAWASSREEAA
jgi:signal transduction histidine kinase